MYVSSHEEQMMVHHAYRLHKQLFIYVPPCLLLIGTVGNILSFCVLLRKSMRATSTYNFLTVLALADMLVLYMGLLRHWVGELTGVDVRDQADWSCKIISVAGNTMSLYSVWLLIAVSVERYIVTVHSLRALTMCTRSRAIKIVTFILVVMISLNCHFIFTTEIRPYDMEDHFVYTCTSAYGYEYLVEHVWPWIDASLYCFVPFIIICILNGLIVQEVILSRRRRQRLLENHIISSDTPPTVLNESSIRLTIMLLSVTFAFLLCTLPMMVTMIYRACADLDETSLDVVARFTLARTVSMLLMYTNHSVNFYLYLLTGTKFRHELHAMFCNNSNYQTTTTRNGGQTSLQRPHLSPPPEAIPLNTQQRTMADPTAAGSCSGCGCQGLMPNSKHTCCANQNGMNQNWG